jgi:hypothetical protein
MIKWFMSTLVGRKSSWGGHGPKQAKEVSGIDEAFGNREDRCQSLVGSCELGERRARPFWAIGQFPVRRKGPRPRP